MSDVQQVNNVTEKKRIVRKKVVKPKVDVNVETTDVSNEETTQTDEVEHHDETDLRFIIPSSRIKNYVNKEKLNKELDQLIEKVKKNEESLDSLVTEEVQKKVGNILKEKEEKGEQNIDINAVTVDVLSKQRFKFSNTSFKVLSVFSDMMIEEVTQYAMAELIKNKKSIINSKYVFNDEIKNGRLYKIYSSLPTFTSFQTTDVVTETTTEEEIPVETSVDEAAEQVAEMSVSHEKKINFEFYIKRICNKIKTSNEEFSNVKVSEKYQKFCSNLILDFLDRVAPLAKIILEVMSTKTITNLVFLTVIKTQLWEVPAYESIISELKQRLEDGLKPKQPPVVSDTVPEPVA